MARERPLSLPAAVVIAGGLIGLGLYFGLRSRVPPPPLETPAVTRSTVTPVLQSSDDVGAEVGAKLVALRASLRAVCSHPSPPGGAGAVRLVFNFTFDAQGNQIARGVVEDRATSRPEVTSCVQTRMPPIRVTPPGRTTYVEVPLSL